MNKASIVIHAHFYQPPRENAWTEEIELQESAAPSHDWNQRILAECYRPNSCARIVSVSGKIVHILNNYEWISFNFGPTLLDWIMKAAPEVYDRILQADRSSLERWGHGNAIAQVYNHIIMPLANDHDRETQIVWGVENFKKHFGRKPEGMWLAETAADERSIEALIQAGIRFTILAPHQAAQIRPLGSEQWTPVSSQTLDTSRAYRVYSKHYHPADNPGAYLDVFFYNGSVAHAVSFGDLLSDSSFLCGALAEAVPAKTGGPSFINLATDGEVYGHHRKFGDMTLAYAIHKGFEEHGLELTNYGAFLEKHPPTHEAQISKGPQGLGESWSCAHGVGRWREDCGCHTGGKPDWNQKWRAPLRAALDGLRDSLAVIFENEGAKRFIDPWRARNNYLQVIMDRSPQRIEQFFQDEGLPGLDDTERATALQLMEIQRHALLMYTSCAWFFSDISGIETIQVLQYAKRAIQLASSLTSADLEKPFLEILDSAQSNIRRNKTGRVIFIKNIRDKVLTPEKIVHHVAVMNFVRGEENLFPQAFNLRLTDYERLDMAGNPLLVGRIEIEPLTIPSKSAYLYALLHQGGVHAHTFVMKDENNPSFRKLADRLASACSKGFRTTQLSLKRIFPGKPLNLKDLLPDYRRIFKKSMMEHSLDRVGQSCGVALAQLEGMSAHLNHLDPYMDDAVKATVLLGLSHELGNALRKLKSGSNELATLGDLKAIFKTASLFDIHLDTEPARQTLSLLALRHARHIRSAVSQNGCAAAMKLLQTAVGLNLDLDLSEAQNTLYDLVRKVNLNDSHTTPPGEDKDEAFTNCLNDRELTASFLKLASMMGFALDAESASHELS